MKEIIVKFFHLKDFGFSEAFTTIIILFLMLFFSILKDCSGATDNQQYYYGRGRTHQLYHTSSNCAAEEAGSYGEIYGEDIDDDDYYKYLSPCKSCVPTTLHYLLGFIFIVAIHLLPLFAMLSVAYLSSKCSELEDAELVNFFKVMLIIIGIVWLAGFLGLEHLVSYIDNYIVSEVFDSVDMFYYCIIPIAAVVIILNNGIKRIVNK